MAMHHHGSVPSCPPEMLAFQEVGVRTWPIGGHVSQQTGSAGEQKTGIWGGVRWERQAGGAGIRKQEVEMKCPRYEMSSVGAGPWRGRRGSRREVGWGEGQTEMRLRLQDLGT